MIFKQNIEIFTLLYHVKHELNDDEILLNHQDNEHLNKDVVGPIYEYQKNKIEYMIIN